MEQNNSLNTNHLDIDKFASSIEELLELCETLLTENGRLSKQNKQLFAEKIKLGEKNQLSQSRVAGMITRLKTLEVEI